MRVGIAINGSRGDIQPYAALGHALAAAGCAVTVTANEDAADLVAASGLRFVPMDLDTRAWLSAPDGQAALRLGTPEALLDSANRWLTGALDSIVKGITEVADGCDLMIAGAQIDDYAAAVCADRGVPMALGYYTPWLRTREFPQVMISRRRPWPARLVQPLTLRTYRQLEAVYWRGKADAVNRLRRGLGLPPATASMLTLAPRLGLTALHGFSTAVVPRPRDWAPTSVVTGYWRLPEAVRHALGEGRVPADVDGWLDAGPPPVYLGFGSMPILDPEPMVHMAAGAARRAGTRVLIGAGWSDLGGLAASLPGHVRIVGPADHSRLFPRCSAVVHHGGAGTTGAGLTAGRPSHVLSMFMDQPFWGSRVRRLGAGDTSRFTELDLESLTGILRRLGDGGVRRRAAALGARLRAEDGVAAAVRHLVEGGPRAHRVPPARLP
ncbi:glycosyltransferase [Dactylosporangium vinaceum]|uniref:Glycosyltransferase n=1 Tax=Dactylosporangium vinaceum TaxID=53362 RepID=A0ABV5M9Y4_9ACTN|nr:nucleotide disphospho-sugar-binding domain-containing protein [Dactylosporangium vinaceum]UAB93138.1 glycosyltransferase [Dactylosporangium vinaceum]